MRFLQILSFASLAFAIPTPAPEDKGLSAPALEKRATVTDTVATSISALSDALKSNSDSITQAIQTISDNVDAQLVVTAQAAIKANLNNIATAIQTATTSIASGTTGALGGVLLALRGLTQTQADQLIASIRQALALLGNVQAVLTVTATNLTPAVKSTLTAEIAAVKASVAPFIVPLTALAAAVQAASITGGLTVTGVNALALGLQSIVQNIISTTV